MRRHLRVIAQRLECLAGRRGQLGRGAGVFEFPGEEVGRRAACRAGRRSRRRPGPVARARDSSHRPKASAMPRPGAYASRRPARTPGVNSVAGSAASSAAERRLDRRGQLHARDGLARWRGLAVDGHGTRRGLGVQHAARVDFVPVVVFGVHPEHRHRRDIVGVAHELGQPERRQRLQHGEERSAEESRPAGR